jgi:beta-glucosidase
MVSYPYLDTSLPIPERVADLVSRMTLAEKVSQTMHNAPPVERLGIPAYNWWNECLHGVGRAGKATVFPQSIGLAATFDPELMYDVATAISDEARAKHHEALRLGNRSWYFGLTFWSPNINIFRDPRWGRGQETYGEDPFLTGRLGVAFVSGLQGDPSAPFRKLDATAKHYAVHSGPESDRHHFDAVVSERDLRETYLPAFEACVKEAKVACIMGAYNRTNGEPCCASPTLLETILREEWGFEGYVVSDCGAICDIHRNHKVTDSPEASAALAVKNGCELNCGGIYAALLGAVDQGLISEAEIDAALTRLFTARFELGMFDPEDQNPYAQIPPEVVNGPIHRNLARRAARESMVLLRNEGNLLPLSRDLHSVAVVGPCAMSFPVLWGNYNGFAGEMVTPMEGIVEAVGPGTRVTYSDGCKTTGTRPIREGDVNRAIRDAEVIVACLGYTPEMEGEEGDAADSDGGGDRRHIGLPGRQLELLQYLHNTGKPVVLVLAGGSPIELNWAAENIPAILMMWYPGEQGGNALADVLFGDASPGGRLPLTFVRSLDQLPPFEDYAMAGRTYRFMEEEPLYRFGFGLSYSTFAYRDASLGQPEIAPDGTTTLTVDVVNTGSVAADEVVQLYIRDVEASVPVPNLHLEGVRRLFLEPGESRTIEFEIGPANLRAFADDGTPFVEPGEFELFVGGTQPADSSGAMLTLTVQ